jgi:hypothetical protein
MVLLDDHVHLQKDPRWRRGYQTHTCLEDGFMGYILCGFCNAYSSLCESSHIGQRLQRKCNHGNMRLNTLTQYPRPPLI